jgi:hypothetical protein
MAEPIVKQVRVLRNVGLTWGLCAIVLWLLRARLWEHRAAIGLGLLLGGALGTARWHLLRRRIARRDRRYERNKIFVHYLSVFDLLVHALAYNLYLSIPLGFGLLGLVVVGVFSPWWSVVVWSALGGAASVVALSVLGYERQHGAVFYQYDSEDWGGAEGLLYQQGRVVEALTPHGKVSVQGVLWNAVSMSGEAIDVGTAIEVIALERLTLYVDRLPA